MTASAHDGVRFERIDSDSLLSEIAALTERDPRDLRYLLFSELNPRSRAFGLFDEDGNLAGFQGFVYKPFLYREQRYHSFRSEFTIALPTLRGTGLFPHFYRWTVAELRNEFGHERNYLWGETKHPGWGKFGFSYHTRYSYYQLHEQADFSVPALGRLTASTPYRASRRAVRALAPRVRGVGTEVAVSRDLPYDSFARICQSNLRPRRCMLEYDEGQFRHRFAANPFIAYDFLTAGAGLVVIGRQDGIAMVSEIRCNRLGDYVRLMAHARERYPNLVVHGNMRSEARSGYLWANLRLGFTLLVGGGSYVENADTAPEVAFRDIPLYEAYAFGTSLA